MSAPKPEVLFYAEASMPTEYGVFRAVVFHEPGLPHEHLALVQGELSGASEVLVRVHSECLTGEVFHSLKCDCREQLQFSMRQIAELGRGIFIYLRQEGRGIGLGNKIRAYALQEEGLDTVDANEALGFEADPRKYHVAASILRYFGVASVALSTNNPAKVRALKQEGVVIARRVGLPFKPSPFNSAYLNAKFTRMGHVGEPPRDPEGKRGRSPLERSDPARSAVLNSPYRK